MILSHCNKVMCLAALGGVFLLTAGAQSAFADTLAITTAAPGVQAPTGVTSYYENFDSVTPSGGTLTTNFNGSPVTGTYTGNFAIMSADAYGGANGSKFISTSGSASSYTLTLSQPVNYFGLWYSALDAGNNINFYNGKELVEAFSPANYAGLVGKCSSTNAYCGNPNNGLDAAEQFAYLNFYDQTGTFNKIVFDQTTTTGQLESDNQAVASLTSAPGGTPVSGVTPEPASLFLFGTGLLGFAGLFRKRLMMAHA